MMDTNNILDYWYNIEFFEPFWPKTDKKTQYVNSKRDWDSKQAAVYNVYLGRGRSCDLIQKMLEAIGRKDKRAEPDTSISCVCAFKVAADGTYIEDSFSVSTYIWAMAKIIYHKDLNTNLRTEEISNFEQRINEHLLAINRQIKYKDLEAICNAVVNSLKLDPRLITFACIINEDYEQVKSTKDSAQTGEYTAAEKLDNKTDMLSSFFAKDIDMIKNQIQPHDEINTYIKALQKPNTDRIEVDVDIQEMKKWLSPEKYPLGKWPSVYNPSLMQQISINICISENKSMSNIRSINGPPGTGKTTLLKEIIVSNIVERAKILSKYNMPDDAFRKRQFSSPKNEFLTNYYEIDPQLIKYGVLVASNNNAAVENISTELPIATKEIKNSHTGFFDTSTNKDIYFSKIASNLLGNDIECWGLISARLGKKENISKFRQTLWFHNEQNLRELFDVRANIAEWEAAKNNFKEKYAEVLNYRKYLVEVVKNTTKHNLLLNQCKKANVALTALNKKIKEKQHAHIEIDDEAQAATERIELLRENIAMLKAEIPFFKRFFSSFLVKKDEALMQLKRMKQELNEATIRLTDIKLKINDLKSDIKILEEQQRALQDKLAQKETALLDSQKLIDKYKKEFGANFADDKFWENIAHNEESQLVSPWTNEEYDTLREELFYHALMLHKAFILNSKRLKQNMHCLMHMWQNAFTEEDQAAGFPHLFNSLFLVVPVLSTTFASVASFLRHIGKKELGTLIIDEAGQATPQSALGAIWRSQKVIVVGDPQQVQPTVTTPKEIIENFANKFSIAPEYKSNEVSVQVFADNINAYGGYRNYAGGRLWVGCPLVIHRRCLNPMFSISNAIAYNNRMFQKTQEPKNKKLFLKKSMWLDIKGSEAGGKNRFVREQGEKVVEMVLQAFRIENDFPNIFIISPFKTVIRETKALLISQLTKQYGHLGKNKIANWVAESCGTVHTFQGKEANEVIFILGCDQKNGIGAAAWAASSPNILNVAVTRAKYRIAIIGDLELWAQLPYFNTAARQIAEYANKHVPVNNLAVQVTQQ